MIKSKYKIDIGIPCYNEGKNIGLLIAELFVQNLKNLTLNKIIISSDGSTDDTVKILRKIDDSRLIIIDNKDRKGIARGLNQIIDNSESDCLITLDADINMVRDQNFLYKLASGILIEKNDHVSSSIEPIKPNNFFGKIIYSSMEVKNFIFDNWKEGNNIFTCHGLARGYSKRFYKRLTFPISVGNDMYSYLKCIKLNYSFKYIKDSIAYYKLPSNFSDHKRQSLRFIDNNNMLYRYFDRSVVDEQTSIKCTELVKCSIGLSLLIMKHNINLVFYVFIFLFIKIFQKNHKLEEAWQISTTTK